MKRWGICLLLGGVAGGVFLWFLARSTPGVQRIGLVGFTNGAMGTMGPMFSNFFRSNATALVAIQVWMAQGTNAAVFVVTNEHKFPIQLDMFARVLTQQGKPALDQTLLINAPSAMGILLQRYQVATVHVAALPQSGPWKVELIYHREPNSYSWLEERLPSALGGLPDQRGAPPNTFMMENRFMESEWIGK